MVGTLFLLQNIIKLVFFGLTFSFHELSIHFFLYFFVAQRSVSEQLIVRVIMSVHQHALPPVLLNLRLDFVMNIYTLLLVDCFLEMNKFVEFTFILNL